MSTRKGIFARAVERLRGQPPQPTFVERGPAQHGDDGYLHASDRVDIEHGREASAPDRTDIEHDRGAAAPEELDRGFGERASNDAVNSER